MLGHPRSHSETPDGIIYGVIFTSPAFKPISQGFKFGWCTGTMLDRFCESLQFELHDQHNANKCRTMGGILGDTVSTTALKTTKKARLSTKKTRKQATAIPEQAPYSGPPTHHTLNLGDARNLDWIPDESVHLVITSPPYFNLKKYNDHPDQLGDMDDYEAFHDQLDEVWRHCMRILCPSGRLIVNVGDVCVARRQNKGRHHVFPLHADISVRARTVGFDYLTPILWNKISNASFEAKGNGAGFLGKPYEPNGIIKNDVEYILMFRKHGKYRSPTDAQRASSRLSKEEQSEWFRPIWTGLTGASTREHPAPYPVDLAYRLIRMFSFTEDTVFDPFGGTGSTTIAAMRANRNSICNELDPEYFDLAHKKVQKEMSQSKIFTAQPKLTTRATEKRKRR